MVINITDLHDINVTLAMADTSKGFGVKWENREGSFGDFVDAFINNPIVTNLTFEEYNNLDKAGRGRAKNVGSFVGATFTDGIRSSAHFIGRQIITLDIDYPDRPADEIFQKFKALGFAGAVYTTHSASKDDPRMRIVVPMVEPLSFDECQPMARALAFIMGMNMDVFDDTTYQPERLMFLPAHAKDGYYYSNSTTGVLLDGRKALSSYYKGQHLDVALWPKSSREKAAGVRASTQFTGASTLDRAEINGGLSLQAVWNKMVPIDEAIEAFLFDVYEAAGFNRYTYLESTSGVQGGLRIYEDGGFVSFHDTDAARMPISYDSYGLVTTHLFGNDPEAYDEMAEWIQEEAPDVWAKYNEQLTKTFESSDYIDYWR